MLRGFRWFALAAVVGIAVLVGPAVARADSCANGGATSIYAECKPTAKGPSHPKPHKTVSKPTTPPPPVYPVTPPATVAPNHHVSRHARHALVVVARAATTVQKGLSFPKHANQVDSVLASAPANESSLGSAFDLGAGPMILFALLAGTVLVLLGTGGVRSWRNRHRV